MRHSEALLILGLVAQCTGCGAVINGLVTKVKLERPSPDVVYVVDGVRIAQDKSEVTIWNDREHTVVALAPDGRFAEMRLVQKFGAAAVPLDILWCLTILGVAAPLSDLLMNTWFYIAPDHVALIPTAPPVAWADLSFDPAALSRMQSGAPTAQPVTPPAQPVAAPPDEDTRKASPDQDTKKTPIKQPRKRRPSLK
jgi:hypothetical protein